MKSLKSLKIGLLTRILEEIFQAIPEEMLVEAADSILDKLEDLVAESDTVIDDAVVLPLIAQIRSAFNIADGDD